VYVCVRACVSVCACARTCLCASACAHMCVCARVRACVCVCARARAWVGVCFFIYSMPHYKVTLHALGLNNYNMVTCNIYNLCTISSLSIVTVILHPVLLCNTYYFWIVSVVHY